MEPHAAGWAIRWPDADYASYVVPTKDDAIQLARRLARQDGTRLLIHRQDGSEQQWIEVERDNPIT